MTWEPEVSRQSPIRPDPMPLREALRGLRFLLRRGGQTLVETVDVDVLPKPFAAFAGTVLREMGGLARNVDEVASGFAKTVLGGNASHNVSLIDPATGPDADAQFAAAVYVALGTVLGRLGAPGVFISEAAARSVFAELMAQDAPKSAAQLTLDLLDARVIRGVKGREAARVPGAVIEPVAVFAVLLWLQANRTDDEHAAALEAATDMAVVLAADINTAFAARDTVAIHELYQRYAAHV
jgi:hypothetical protein